VTSVAKGSLWSVGAEKTPVDRQVKTSERIASAIVGLVIEQGLKEGDRLPNESEMIEQFRVGRGSLREALRILETYGMISLRSGPGGGPVILNVSPADVSRSFSLYLKLSGATIHELADARKVIDPLMARLAAENMNELAAQQLREALDREEKAARDKTTVVATANDFHYVLASLTGNSVLNLVATSLKEMYTSRFVMIGLAERVTRPSIRKEHRRIGDAVLNGDADLAEKLMREHAAKHFDQALRISPSFSNSVISWG
jgi:GntR family transcriptional regulator, transcriptional repressor for pyruvate dehydrogenase complex